MNFPAAMEGQLLAPCGMNCLFCYKHCASPKPCRGCWANEGDKPSHCRSCAIRDCAAAQGLSNCAACGQFPCSRVKSLDRGYRRKYQVSLVERGRERLRLGDSAQWELDCRRFACPACGEVLSLHDGICSGCGRPALWREGEGR